MKRKKQKTYSVVWEVSGPISCEIEASSEEEALSIASEMSFSDVGCDHDLHMEIDQIEVTK